MMTTFVESECLKDLDFLIVGAVMTSEQYEGQDSGRDSLEGRVFSSSSRSTLDRLEVELCGEIHNVKIGELDSESYVIFLNKEFYLFYYRML